MYMKKTQEVPLNEYSRKFKEVCDSLAAIGHMVDDKNKVFSFVTRLGARYEPFATSMLKPPMPSYNEVIPLLQGYEPRLNLHTPESSQYTAFYADKNVPKNAPKNPKPTNNFSSKGKGFIPTNQPSKNFSNGSFSNAFPRENHRDITCQICGKKGHPAIRCWYRFNHSIQPDNLPQAFIALQLNFESHHEEWTSDTSALAHMTSNEGNLHNFKPYTGNDHVMLGNGEFLKDKLTQQVQMRGLKKGNLYAIRAPLVALFSSRFWVALEDIWHQRLGHVQAAAVAHLRNKALISTISNKDNSISAGIQPTTFREFDSWSTPSCEHSDHFTQPEEEAPLPTPNA
ncbi:hypothetical protein Pint_34225 [Pistacia integerrima]|uniref:Uncharacterized protein n=1 Tax=Pistacia integerrima TaxID=434235 RepID=A0ACC0X8L2_9ROSI|nr:hypothetical protein Pint_34225 [Pistacia integerrima]